MSKSRKQRPLSDRQIVNWLAGKLNARKGARVSISLLDNRDIGCYGDNRISIIGEGGTVGRNARDALSNLIRQQKRAKRPS